MMASLMDVCMEKLEGTIILLLRNVYIQEDSEKTAEFMVKLFTTLRNKQETIADKCPDALVPIVFKCLRLISVTMLFSDCKKLQEILIEIINFAWTNQQESKKY